MLKVYLSGGMRSGWQDQVRDECPNLKYIDPRLNGRAAASEYTLWDLEGIKQCDIVFAYLEKDNPSGFGLAVEIGYAKALGKTVVFVNEKDDRYTAIINFTADIVYNTLDLALDFLKSFENLES